MILAEEKSARRWRVWPLSPKWSLLTSLLLLAALLLALVLLRMFAGWPGDALLPVILVAAAVITGIPLLFMVIEVAAQSNGSVEALGFGFSFGAPAADSMSSQDLPPNFGVPESLPIADSRGPQVIQALEQFPRSDVAVIDLEDGSAWWETRLAVVCSGAARLRRPKAIAFTATENEKRHRFVGWGEPERLLRALYRARPELQHAADAAAAATARWALAYPPGGDPVQGMLPPLADPVAGHLGALAFAGSTRRLDAPEQFLLHELAKLEEQRPQGISVIKLRDLFGAFLHREAVDEKQPSQEWIRTVLCSESEYVAVTRCGTFVGLLSRLAVLNQVLRSRLFPDVDCGDCRPPEQTV
ncbi:hypothetical protein MF672_031465 [Actinomadura sp. ATCC 31491]|uniref:CBS domain-containing protein n=1 Tax=Actinomadura luzonensis TaxID=2805427 RepID=A0ABT0G103_9ACTN|nr:hypothetical protein [Actinomadura luzonensis]MCK2218276.1 hypothetical protein [Actinomadura luzonensis]